MTRDRAAGTGYALTEREFSYLVGVASRRDARRVAGWLELEVRGERGSGRFYDPDGEEVALAEVHRLLQERPDTQRRVYQLWMSYAR